MFGISSLELKIGAALVLIVALALGKHFYDASIKAEALAPVRAVGEATSAANAATSTQRVADQGENLRENQRLVMVHATQSRGLDDAVQRVRDDAARSRSAASHSQASSGSQAASMQGADMVPGELYRAALDARAAADEARADAESDARDLAEFAECLRSSGQLCADDYATLKP